MLNVKKISIIKAAVFGLILSNAGIAAGVGAGAGEPVAAVPVASPFLISLHGLDPQDFLEQVYRPVRRACNAGECLSSVVDDALREGLDVFAAEAILNKIFDDIALIHPMSQQDREIFKILGEGRGVMHQDMEDAVSNRLGELTAHYPAMIDPEKNLWILLWRFQYNFLRDIIEAPQDRENALRGALDAYHDAIAAAAIGHEDEDMGGM